MSLSVRQLLEKILTFRNNCIGNLGPIILESQAEAERLLPLVRLLLFSAGKNEYALEIFLYKDLEKYTGSPLVATFAEGVRIRLVDAGAPSDVRLSVALYSELDIIRKHGSFEDMYR